MRIFIRVFAIILLITVSESCSLFSYPVSTQKPDNNRTYQVDYLFEHDGCKVYRFYDMGNYVYFTNCKGDVINIKNDSTSKRVTNSVRITYDENN